MRFYVVYRDGIWRRTLEFRNAAEAMARIRVMFKSGPEIMEIGALNDANRRVVLMGPRLLRALARRFQRDR